MTTPREKLEARGFERACALSEVPEIMPRQVTLGGKALLVCRTEPGRCRAVAELCPHKALSMAFGIVHDGAIICPHHQYRFDLKTGRSSMRRCAPLELYDTEVLDGKVFIKVAHPQEG